MVLSTQYNNKNNPYLMDYVYTRNLANDNEMYMYNCKNMTIGYVQVEVLNFTFHFGEDWQMLVGKKIITLPLYLTKRQS